MKRIINILIIIFIFSPCILKAQDDTPCEKIKNKKATKLYDQAVSEYNKKMFPNASKLLHDAINMENEYVDAYFLLGMINVRKTGEGDEAVFNARAAMKYFRQVIKLCPNYENPYSWFYLGELYYGIEKYDSAAICYNKFLDAAEKADKIVKPADFDKASSMEKFAKDYSEVTSKSVPFNPHPVKGICTKLDEYLAIISADNEIALFTRKDSMPPKVGAIAMDAGFKEKFIMSTRYGGEFDRGKPLPSPFNKFDNEGGPTLSIDNKLLIYTVSKMVGGYLNTDLYYSEFIDGKWTEIKSMGPKINSPDSWESQPSLSSDGKTLYFASNRRGGFGGIDIWKSIKDQNGEWGMPVNLGKTINTAGDEKSPFIHPDNKTLYFSSTGLPGLGGYDIFFAKMDDNGKWSTPKNIGYPINSKEDDFGFFVSTDGKTGFFNSNRKGIGGVGGWDIYSFDLYEGARPEKVLFLKGDVKDETTNEPVRAKVTLKNVDTKEITEIAVDTTTGKYVAAVLFKNDYILSVKKEGYAYESKYIAREDTTFSTPAKVDMQIEPLVVGKAYEIKDIKYATASAELTETSKFILNGFIEFLTYNPELKVSIHGFTDDVGNDEYNLKLSDDRAKSVYTYLIENNIQADRLSFKGFGETQPKASNKTAEGRAKNRRTEFVIVEK